MVITSNDNFVSKNQMNTNNVTVKKRDKPVIREETLPSTN